MKHVLRSLESNKSETTKLRNEMRNEHSALSERLTKVERFNTKVLTYATVAVTVGVPVMAAIIKWVVPAVLNLI